jgi:hypothetical protein
MKDITNYLIRIFKNNVNLSMQADFEDWIKRCSKFDVDSKRLLYCIGIDVKCCLTNIDKYTQLFNEIDYGSSFKPQVQFENALLKDDGKYHFFSSESENKRNEEYCGLIKLWEFGKYYLNKSYTKDELKYLKECLVDRIYENIEIPFNSSKKPREVSWVTTQNILDELISEAGKYPVEKIDFVCNKLGLYWDHMGTIEDPLPEWISLTYPKDMDETFYQPLTVNGDWKSENGLYLSYKKFDGFGRTRSCTKLKSFKGVKERVHYRINKSYIYSAKYLGKVVNCIKNTNSILKSATFRYYER